MKVYALPKEVPAPEVDYKNYDRHAEQAKEDAHKAALKAWLIKSGYTGKNTGKIFSTPMADGYANYMFADGSKAALIHLPYGDGWNARDVVYLPKKEVLKRIEQTGKLDAMFAARG